MKLLIVDDEHFTIQGIRRMLPWSEMGIGEIELAGDGLQALEIAARFQPEIILTDVRMPRMDGIQLGFQVRKKLPHCQIIFMSGYSEKAYLKNAIELNAVSYIDKPFGREELRVAVEKASANCQHTHEREQHNQTWASGLRLLKMELALKLIRPQAELDTITDLLRLTQIATPGSQSFRTVSIHFFQAVEDKDQIYLAVEEIAEEHCLWELMSFKDDYYLIIHIYGHNPATGLLLEQEKIHGFLNQIIAELKDVYQFHLSLGKQVEGMNKIYDSYLSSVCGLQKAFYHKSHTIVYEELASCTASFTFPETLLDDFRRILDTESVESVKTYILKLTNQVRLSNQLPVNRIKDRYFQLLLELIRYSEKRGIPLIDPNENHGFLWEMIYQCRTLDEIKGLLLLKIEDVYQRLQPNQDPVVISQILRQIHENYQDDELNVNEISRRLFLTYQKV